MQTTAKLLIGGVIGLAVIGGAIGAMRGMGGQQPLANSNVGKPQVKILVTTYPQANPPAAAPNNVQEQLAPQAGAPANAPAGAPASNGVPQLPPLDFSNKAYPDQINLLNEQFNIMVEDFTARSKAAQDNPTLMADEAWKANIAQDLAQIKTLVDAARTLTPPDDYSGVQKWLNHSADAYDKFIAAYDQGVQSQDAGQLDAGLRAFKDGNTALKQAAHNMADVQAELQ